MMEHRARGSLGLDQQVQPREYGRVVEVDPCVDPRWQRLVERLDSDVFHSPRWMRALRDTYDLQVRSVVLLDEYDEPAAGVPYVLVPDPSGGRIVSMPFSDYCDPLVSSRQEWDILAGELLGRDCLITTRCLHNPVPLDDERFALVNRARWHGVDLTPGTEAIWERLGDSPRRAIRKALKQEVEIRVAESEEELRAFHRLHLGVRKHKYHMLAQPYLFFQKLWQEFVLARKGFLLLAKVQGQVIGGVLFLQWKDTLYYKFNASDPAHLGYRPNDLLMWNAIQQGVDRGFSRLDLGLSDWDQEELIRYKRKYAGEEKTISFLRYLPPGRSLEASTGKWEVLRQAVELLTDESVPDDVTARAGDVMYRHFM